MNIVFEGPDNSGKSTLARYVARYISWGVILSEGPERTPGEINDRVRRYEPFDRVIFDRHPCVSQPIYGEFRRNTPVEMELIHRFYDTRPLFIFCVGRDLDNHVEKDHDSPEHLASVKRNHQLICRSYEEWGIRHAHVFYRVGDSMQQVLKQIQGVL